MTALRPYQLAAVDAIRHELARVRRTLVEMATGTGKTRVFADVARRVVARGRRVLVLAHRTELLEQAQAKLAEAGVDAAIEQGAKHAGHADVVVASVQTLKGKRLAAYDPDTFGLVVVDEAHRTPSPSYRAVLDTFASAYVLGVTASADRLDGQALGDVYDSVAFRYELRQAIADEWLVPLVARRVSLESVDLSAVRTVGGDLDPAQVETLMLEERALHGVVVPLLRECRNRRPIAFAAGVTHAHRLAEVANRYEPGVARAIDGDMKPSARKILLAEHRSGAFRILFNAALLAEGYDDPGCNAVALIAPTKSRGLNLQRIGRGTRLSPETGKRDVLILDFVGQVGRHRLAGPADALAGHFVPDDQRALLDALFLQPGDVDLERALVETAEAAEQNARAEAASAIAKYRVEELDPWLDVPRTLEHETDGEPATDKQLAALKKLAITARDGMSKTEAGRILGAHAKRLDAGLCSVRAAKMLARLSVPDAATVTAEQAKPLLAAARVTGWRYVPGSLLRNLAAQRAALQPATSEAA